MQTILHIGMAKTGTTALQATFARSRSYLREHGVLYPATPSNQKSHELLVCNVMRFGALPRAMRPRYHNQAEVAAEYNRFVKEMRHDIEQQATRCIVLSSEYLFCPIGRGFRGDLPHLFDKLQTKVDCVAYIRRPSDRLKSGRQQALKHSAKEWRPRTAECRRVLETYEGIFGRESMHVHEFRRDALIGKDIVSDFMHRFLAGYGAERQQMTDAGSLNETLSAESTDLSRRYRLAFHAGQDNQVVRSTAALLDALRHADAAVGAGRPQLQPGIADLVDYCNTDPLWLRDRYGLEFPDFDYARLERGDLAPLPERSFSLAELMQVDLRIERDLLHVLAASEWGRSAAHRPWIESVLTELG